MENILELNANYCNNAHQHSFEMCDLSRSESSVVQTNSEPSFKLALDRGNSFQGDEKKIALCVSMVLPPLQ